MLKKGGESIPGKKVVFQSIAKSKLSTGKKRKKIIVLKVSPDVVDIGVFCCLLVVCMYMCSAGYVDRPIVLLYLLRCLVYHVLSNTKRNSRSSHRMIAYI